MMLFDPLAMARRTVTAPAEAAQALMGLGLSRQVLWTALILMAVLQSAIFGFSVLMAPPMPEGVAMAELFTSPLRFFVLAAVALALTVYGLLFIGRAMGGSGTIEDILVLVVWLQALRVAIQLVVLVLSFLVPVLATLAVLAATIIGIYVMVRFINQAHRLNSLGRAVGVLIAASLGVVIGLSVILALIGLPLGGASGYV
ncbi:MAG: YIP1 family protein [Pseudooceanicola sp.]|nr:YIP1 family protein [Pseudooceanicola sp.]|tara:strand:- start:97 stop:696 length:600 start_codon:yes stop_codon:yes gene_type:complete